MTAAATIYLDALLEPNQSLSPRALAWIVAGVAGVSLVASLSFLKIGALPVVGFFGLDALAVALALRHNYRVQRQRTRVRVTADEVRLDHVDPRGRSKSAGVPTAFARVELDEPLTPASLLRIEHGRKAYVIGRFLTAPERKSLAEALRRAIRRARLERFDA